MATSNPGPGVSANPNEMQLRSTFDSNGKLIQILGPGQTVAYDPANVAITGGTVNGASLQGSVPFNPANVAITGGVITGGAIKGVKARISDSRLRQHLYNSGYLQPAPAWATATAYSTGQAVTSSGNTYMCMTGGTSASTPTLTTPGIIADGAIGWYYFGVAPNTDLSAPTITTGSTAPPLTAIKSSVTTTNWYDVLGGNFLLSALGPTLTVSEPLNTQGLAIEFMTDSPDFASLWQYGTVPVRVAVDGKLVSPTVFQGTGSFFIRLTFPAGVRKVRKITFYWDGSNSFAAVYSAPTDRFYKVPAAVASFNLFMVGDSYSGGSSYHPCARDRMPHHLLAEMLGARQYQADGVGGSGYTVPGTGTVFGSAIRLARIPTGQDVIVVAGGINDANAGLQAAVQSYLVALRAAQAIALICVLGPWAGTTGPDATTNTKEASILAAVTAVADTNIVFVPVNSDGTGAWLFGTGRVSAQNASGNTDVYTSPDGTHPVCLGAEYLMQRVADAIRTQIRPALT